MNQYKTILIVDDELPIRRLLVASLPEEEFRTVECATGKEAIRLTATHNPDLIFLDLGLPDFDGLEVLRRIREWNQVPIIVLSARGDERDKVFALDQGANDYVTKPFSVAELSARMRVALRLAQQSARGGQAQISFGDITIDFERRTVERNGEEIHLTPHEFKLLALLAQNLGKVMTHRQLLTEVWGAAYARQVQYLRVFMAQLRRKLECDPARPKHLTTDPGIGYRLK